MQVQVAAIAQRCAQLQVWRHVNKQAGLMLDKAALLLAAAGEVPAQQGAQAAAGAGAEGSRAESSMSGECLRLQEVAVALQDSTSAVNHIW